MTMRQTTTLSAIAIAASILPSYAGLCSADINAMQSRIDATLETKAARGPTAKEGTMAGMSRQPTPRSIATAEKNLGEISAQQVAAVKQAMARARDADAAGDETTCTQALAEVQHLINP